MMDLERQAEIFATMAHSGQKRWDGKTDHIQHCRKVVSLLKGVGISDPYVISAGWLHDVLEDTNYSIGNDFGVVINSLVHELTHGKVSDETYIKLCSKMSREAALIKICDIIANIGDLNFRPQLGKGISAFVDKRLRALQVLIPKVL